MSSKKKQAELREEKSWERVDNAVFESENFLAKYSKQLMIGVGVIVAIACGYLAYDQLYVQPKNQKGQVAIFKGEQYFRMGQDSLAIFGDGNGYVGFEAIAAEYGSTKVGNLAKAYAGICYANMGQYEKALTFLQDYSGSDALFSQTVNGTIGDCLDNLGKTDEAVSHFMKAAQGANNPLHSPIFYKKAALIYRDKGDYDKVIEIFTTVKNQYMNSPIAATEADKFIEEATILKGNK